MYHHFPKTDTMNPGKKFCLHHIGSKQTNMATIFSRDNLKKDMKSNHDDEDHDL